MKIAIGCDHGGLELKHEVIHILEAKGIQYQDVGCYSSESVDYPDFSKLVCEQVLEDRADYGILICGTGIGMAISANRNPMIRAALCHDAFTTRMAREHNNANVLCLGARVTGVGVALDIVSIWLESQFEGGRHIQRIEKMS